MAVKSILEIEVRDDAFEKFKKSFESYKESVQDSKKAWKDVGDTAGEALDKTADAVDDVRQETDKIAESSGKAADNFNKQYAAIIGQATGLNKIANSQASASRSANQQAQFWHNIARSSKSFASNMANATRSFLQWASITGLVSGLLGAGGLFGISRLAQSAGESRRGALGLGVTPGEKSAFEINYGRLVDPDAVLSGVNQARLSPQGRASLLGAGLSGQDIETKNTAELAQASIQSIKKLVDATPDMLLSTLRDSHLLGQLGYTTEDLKRIKGTPQSEIDEYGRHFTEDRKTVDLTTGQQKAWQDLQTQLKRAGAQIEATFITGLTPLAKPLEHLSEAFTKLLSDLMKNPLIGEWLDKLAGALEHLATYLTDPEFQKDLARFRKYITDFASGVGDFLGYVGDFTGGVKGLKDDLTAIKTGVLSEFETDMRDLNGVVKLVTDAFKVIGDWLPSLDPRSHNVTPPDEQQPKVEPYNVWKPWTWLHNAENTPSVTPPSNSIVRGLRNNNPLNLEYRPGQGASGSDGRFGVYPSMEAGISAEHQQLLRYQARGIDTLSGIIGTWAPRSDKNDTDSYIAAVSKGTGIDANRHIDLHDPQIAAAVIREMAKRESGPVDQRVIERGVAMSSMNMGGAQPHGMPSASQVNVRVYNSTSANVNITGNQLPQ